MAEHTHQWKSTQQFKELEGNTQIGYVTYSCECGAKGKEQTKDNGLIEIVVVE